VVRVYEKIRPGIWVYNGIFNLVDSWAETSGNRKVFKFKLELADTGSEHRTANIADEDDDDRLIPSWVKLEVWKRDKGHCTSAERTPVFISTTSSRTRKVVRRRTRRTFRF
jgi:hypothetical protein